MAQPLKILCFGDSLTAGYSQWGLLHTPYSTSLRTFLDEALGGEFRVEIDTRGVSGEMVAHMGVRMGGIYLQPKTDQEPYDIVIFLGGTNDLGRGRKAKQIWKDIHDLLELPRERGARVLVMTVPECGVVSAGLDRRREELNRRIRGWEKGFVFDLKEKIPYHSIGAEEREEIWDDLVHFTEAGYEKMGRMVGERVVEILRDGK